MGSVMGQRISAGLACQGPARPRRASAYHPKARVASMGLRFTLLHGRWLGSRMRIPTQFAPAVASVAVAVRISAMAAVADE